MIKSAVTVCTLSLNFWQLIQSESTGSCDNQPGTNLEREKQMHTTAAKTSN